MLLPYKADHYCGSFAQQDVAGVSLLSSLLLPPFSPSQVVIWLFQLLFVVVIDSINSLLL